MHNARAPFAVYRFGPFRLNAAQGILERDGERVQLTPKAIDTLVFLVENSGRVVTKEELMRAVWPGVNVVESGLTRNVSALRKALEGESAEGSYIETIPKRGYRFLSEVTAEAEPVNENASASTEQPSLPAPSRVPIRLGLASVVVVILGIGAYWVAKQRPSAPAVDAGVRIGEHLLYKLAPEEITRAAEYFERVIAERPNSANAHAGLAVSLLYQASMGVRPMAEILPRSEQEAQAALRLDGGSAAAHYAIGIVYYFKDWNFAAAEASLQRALQLQPDSAQTRMGYARLKWTLGDAQGAQRLIGESLQLDPVSPLLGTEYCRGFYYQRDFHRAESECRKVLDREPGYALAHYYLALCLGSLGRIREAETALTKSGLVAGILEADRAWLLLRGGNRQPALAALEQRRQLMREGVIDASSKLLLATGLGFMDEAFEALEAGLANRAPELLSLLEPRLDALRSDPRYPSVLQRIGIHGR